MGNEKRYAFDNAWQQERQRLAAIEAWLDPGTTRHLTERRVGAGWRCLEVGAGGGSIAEWLCERVGPTGSVLATDLDPRFVEAIDRANLETRRHDIGHDPLPADTFDLAHTRLVIAHVQDREAALGRMIAALKPGGWLLVEEMDFGSVALDPRCGDEAVELFEKALVAHHQVMRTHGFDPFYGRCLLGDLRGQGLVEIGTEGRLSCWEGGSALPTAWRLTFEHLGEQMVATRIVSSEELAVVKALFDNPSLVMLSQATVAAWGRRAAV